MVEGETAFFLSLSKQRIEDQKEEKFIFVVFSLKSTPYILSKLICWPY